MRWSGREENSACGIANHRRWSHGAISRAAGLAKNPNSTDDPGSASEFDDRLTGEQASSAENLHVNEDALLATLKQSEITGAEIAEISKSVVAAKSRKVTLAVVIHARTPRHISVPLLRRMFTFDLMQVALTPVVAADIKHAAEDQIVLRAESLPLGEKISLAKRASGRVAAALLQENDAHVIATALDNAQMTEALIVQALMKARAPERLFVLVSGHLRWSQRREVQAALLRSEKTPLERAREFTANFPVEFVRDIVPDSRKSELIVEG